MGVKRVYGAAGYNGVFMFLKHKITQTRHAAKTASFLKNLCLEFVFEILSNNNCFYELINGWGLCEHMVAVAT